MANGAEIQVEEPQLMAWVDGLPGDVCCSPVTGLKFNQRRALVQSIGQHNLISPISNSVLHSPFQSCHVIDLITDEYY